MGKIAVAIVSGGMDSVTLAYWLKSQGYELSLLSFDYGQRHKKELTFAAKAAETLGAKHAVVDLAGLRSLLPGSSLTDNIEVPDGHYAEESMKITVVPNRNAIMLSIAFGHALAIGAEVVAIGNHGGDHFIYPDCRPEFIETFAKMQKVGMEGFGADTLELLSPFLNLTKANIATIGRDLGVPFADTWSCYKGGDIHCGTCGTCVERKEAMILGEVEDPTEYLA